MFIRYYLSFFDKPNGMLKEALALETVEAIQVKESDLPYVWFFSHVNIVQNIDKINNR